MLDRSRNESEARRLAERIELYMDEFPGRRANIIALSAGTGIATWALEALPSKYHVGPWVSRSALSRDYDSAWRCSGSTGTCTCFTPRAIRS